MVFFSVILVSWRKNPFSHSQMSTSPSLLL